MKILESARPENCFYCIDGSVLHSILELRQKLKTISPQAFYHHVSQSRNDFHNWIRDVFQDYELANDILKAKTPAAAAAIVDRHLRRALLAEEEIDQAISKIIKARIRAVTPAPAAKRTKEQKPKQKLQMKKKKTRRPQKVQKNKNMGKKRKLNKKRNRKITKISSKHIHNNRGSRGKPKSLKSDWAQSPGRRNSAKSGMRNRAKPDLRLGRGKKQVNMWLKWLKLVPEL